MMIETELCSDTQLVDRCLGGDREAFGRIVERYQGLVCALAYNACGDIGRSEDLAQETFLAAWRSLKNLKDRDRLKQWLCGIARHLIQETYRRATRDPMTASAPLEEGVTEGRGSVQPSEQMISKEEQAILWRVLEGLPATYREPLILFYRQSQSVAEVAETMELSEDAVKQRLSRGRAILTERTAKFVETALRGSGPGKAFTLGVLAALPLMTTSAKAAVVGATAAKGSAVAKSAGLIGLANAVLGPVIMFLSMYFGYRLERDSARSPQQREFVIKAYRIMVACIVAFMLAVLSLTLGGWQTHPKLFVGLLIGLGLVYIIVIAALTLWMRWRRLEIREQETAGSPSPLTGEAVDSSPVPVFEYRSKLSLLGLPLVHIRIRGGLERGPVKAWIAAGDAAIGVIVAFGAVAIAPISFGGLSMGLLTLGGFAVGLVPFGGFSFGPWALGGFAVGWQAFGGCAVGWLAAEGGVAVARDFAVGGVALARHANNDAATAFIQNSAFFHNALVVMRHVHWIYLVCLLPLILWWRSVRARQRKDSGNV
jgi:RNA polymerase sigma factor (sigma-70 family)